MRKLLFLLGLWLIGGIQLSAQIGEQKWIAPFLQGNESWAEWRRTGYLNYSQPKTL